MHATLSAFKSEGEVRAGDDVLLDRIGARTLRRARARRLWGSLRLSARLRFAIIAAAAMLLFGSLAFAYRALSRPRTEEPASSPRAPAHSPADRLATRTPLLRQAPVPVPSATPEPHVAPGVSAAPAVSAARENRARPLESGAAIADGPREQFARANRLRREGRVEEASELYSRLLVDFPTSREAAPSRLALAKLLKASDPAAALQHFQALARANGALRAEALWGIVECAPSLGRDAVAESALEALRREYPDSPYAKEEAPGRHVGP